MQHYQYTVRQNSVASRNPDPRSPQSPQRSPSLSHPQISPPVLPEHHVPSTASPLRRASIITELGEAPAPLVSPRTFASPSMSQQDLQAVNDLTKQLAENSYLYASHVQLVTLLHRGFIAYILSSDSEEPKQDPHRFPLLKDLRQAREAMDTRFSCGEDLRLDWIKDEMMLARTTEDRMMVMELCRKAVDDEAGSPQLWRLYGDWMWYLHKTAKDVSSASAYEAGFLDPDTVVGRVVRDQVWSEEDKAVGSEVFSWDSTLSVWQEAVAATQWHISDSHLVWDSYMQLLLGQLEASPNPEKILHVRHLFSDRLRTPHLTWDETFQVFSHFVTTYDKSSYENTMVFEMEKAARTKQELQLRKDTEERLQRAVASEDRESEWSVMSEYLEWEFTQYRRKNSPHFSLNLLIALCERCSLRFPTDAGFWEDHLDLQGERAQANDAVIAVALRATRHAPWVGNLWSKYLYALEAANVPFEEVENVKHRATSTGLLEEVDMSELIKVYSAWCGYLRRRAFSPRSGEDEQDVAEVAIRSAIENVKDTGQKRFGKDFKGDPAFRIERIYFKFLAQTNNFDEARRYWQQLSVTHGDQYDFWERWYLWEMVVWSKQSTTDRPEQATAVLLKAIRRPGLDWPERLIDQFLHHCCQNESVEKVQEAHIEARKRSKEVTKRRSKETADQAAAQQAAVAEQQAAGLGGADVEMSTDQGAPSLVKRKRSEAEGDAELAKRVKVEHQLSGAAADESSSKPAQVKRDRENTSIIVKNLPAAVEEVKVRQFFRDCGEILSLIVTRVDDNHAYATIEFGSQDDVVVAQTKNLKSLEGREVEIQAGSGTTLWVTNYPPEADEKYIRELFAPFGDITSVRFPSLKVNSHRRFCYVQFRDAAEAQAATTMDGKALGGQLVLSAKISNPMAKKDRTGPIEEGRECYVGNVERNAREEDVKELLGAYGVVESVRVLRKPNGVSKGAAFVVFTTKEAAASAAAGLNNKEFRSRILKVDVSKPNHVKAKSILRVQGEGASTSPDPEQLPDAGSPAASESTTTGSSGSTYHARCLTLLNVPDTVNDSRIRAVAEAWGPIRKVVLRSDKAGALVEFENIADVGKAGMALDGYEITDRKSVV